MDSPIPVSAPTVIAVPTRAQKTLSSTGRFFRKKSVIGLCAVAILGGGYAWAQTHKAVVPVRYVLGAITKGTLVVSVSGSGQVSDENQLDVKPSVQAGITAINVKVGDNVKAGDVLVTLDDKDAQKTVRDAAQSVKDAQLSVQSAQLSLQKLQQKDPQTILRAQDTLNQAQRALDDLKNPDATDVSQAEADLQIKQDDTKMSSDGVTPQTVRDAIDSAASDVKDAEQTMSDARDTADGVLGVDSMSLNDSFEKYLSVMNSALLPNAESAYTATKAPLVALKTSVNALSASTASEADVETAADAAVSLADQMDIMLRMVQDVLANTVISSTFTQSSLDGLRNGINSARSSVASQRDKLSNVRDDLRTAHTTYADALLNVQKAQDTLDKLKNPDASDLSSAEERLAEAQAAFNDANAGPDAIDVATSKNSVSSRVSALATANDRLQDAHDALADYVIKAPFDAAVASVAAKIGDQPTGGTTMLTLLTKDRIAKITVNEVDATKIQVGEKATLTFDAVPDLSIAGTVSQVDAVGTVSQGVVNYGVVISFDSSDDRIKPGMSVSASIATDVKTDALLAPVGAVQTSTDGSATVQTLPGVTGDAATSAAGVTSPTRPQTVSVQTGLANDQSIEITSGLNEGDLIVIRTIQPAVAAAARSTTTSGIPGLGGGAVRAGGNAGFGGGGGFTRGAATGR